jgi:hypothetical protein
MMDNYKFHIFKMDKALELQVLGSSQGACHSPVGANVSTNIVFSTWPSSNISKGRFQKEALSFLIFISICNCAANLTVRCKLQLCAANFTMHCKLHCTLQTQLCANCKLANCKLNCALQTQLCTANSTGTQKIIFSS